jgi:hypothetical protein
MHAAPHSPGAPPSSPAARRPSNAQPAQQTIPVACQSPLAAPDSARATRLPCGAARSGNASVAATTLVRRTHGCTARPRAASSLLCALSQSPPSATGASDMIGMPTRYAQARVSPGSRAASRGRKPGAAPSRHSPTARPVDRCTRRTLRTASLYSSNMPSSSASFSAVCLPSPYACGDRTPALPLRSPYPLLFNTSRSAPAKTRAAMVAL